MSNFLGSIARTSRGAWVVHHAGKTANAIGGASEFPAIDTAGKAAALLSQLAGTSELTLSKDRLGALAKVIGLNPHTEVPALLNLLKDRQLIDQAGDGSVAVLGLSTHATVGHAADLFDDITPTAEERASLAIAELTSKNPRLSDEICEFVGDEFKLTRKRSAEFLDRAAVVGFIDEEGEGVDRLLFNGNLFRRGDVDKARKVLESLNSDETTKLTSIDQQIERSGCLRFIDVENALGSQLFEKLRAAGLFDVHHVANPSGEFGYVTKPAAFHKFNDPMADDAFDLAKALVAALTYGMKDSSSGRGRIDQIALLLRRLVNGHEVGPATAIEQDYRVLETRGVVATRPGERYGRYMRLLKRDIGEMALRVLTTGETAAASAIDRATIGSMTGYVSPESDRSKLRLRQTPKSKALTYDVLSAVRERTL